MSTLTTLEQKYKELGAEIEALRGAESWPVYGDRYYLINNIGEVTVYNWVGDTQDIALKTSHNIFRTEEEAQAKADWRQMTDDLWAYAKEVNEGWEADWADRSERKWILYYIGDQFFSNYWMTNQYLTPIFKTEALAKQAIKHFGDRLNILRDYKG